MSRHTLSKEKFESMISDEHYTILNYYCIDDRDTKYVEIESPFNQKIFFIRIPSKYHLVAPKSGSIIYMKEIDYDKNDENVAYWNTFNTSSLQFVIVSAVYFTHVNSKEENIRKYEMTNEPIRVKIDPIELLEKKTRRFIREDKKGDKEIIKDPFTECTDDETTEGPSGPNGPQKAKIVFQDDEGNQVSKNDPIEKMLDGKRGSESSESEDEEDDTEGDGKEYKGDKTDPLFYFSSEEDDYGQVQLESRKIKEEYSVGQFYICVDLKYFFDHVKTFDDELARQYSVVQKHEENENEKRYHDVLELLDKYKEYLKKEYTSLQEENRSDTEQLRRLSRITVGTKNKLKVDPNNEELKKLYIESMKMVEDIHSRIMERRDKVCELLLDTKMYVDELMI